MDSSSRTREHVLTKEDAMGHFGNDARRYLTRIGNLATGCGMLGTIVGLVRCFSAMAQPNPAMKAAVLAQGISEATTCTAFGLLIGLAWLLVDPKR
jgi:biopolymer transport protein ExbB/TolQ